MTTPTSRQSWTVALTASLYFFVVFIQMNMFNALAHGLSQSFHLGAVELGQLSAVFFYANIFALLPAGVFVDRFSPKQVILTSHAIFLGLTFLLSICTGYHQALMIRVLQGMVASTAWVSVLKLSARWFPSHKLAAAIGILVAFITSGGVVAQTPLAWLSDHLGWRLTLQALCALAAVLVIPMLTCIKDAPEGSHTNQATAFSWVGLWMLLSRAIKNPQNWLAGLYICTINLPLFIYGAIWGEPYLVTVHGLTHLQASYATGAIFLGMMAGASFLGWLSDRIRLRCLPMRAIALGSLALGLLIEWLPSSPLWLLVALFLLMGFLVGGQTIGYPYAVEHSEPEVAGTANALVSIIIMLGSFGQPLFGYFLERAHHADTLHHLATYSAHDFQMSHGLLLGSFVLAVVVSWVMKETHCRPLHG